MGHWRDSWDKIQQKRINSHNNKSLEIRAYAALYCIITNGLDKSVNPYVAGSSPAARANNSGASTRSPVFIKNPFATYLLPKA